MPVQALSIVVAPTQHGPAWLAYAALTGATCLMMKTLDLVSLSRYWYVLTSSNMSNFGDVVAVFPTASPVAKTFVKFIQLGMQQAQ